MLDPKYLKSTENFSEDIKLDSELEIIHDVITQNQAIIRYNCNFGVKEVKRVQNYIDRIGVYFKDKKEFMEYAKSWHDRELENLMIHSQPTTEYII